MSLRPPRDIINAGIVHDFTEAYTLAIPAFAHYKLLPTGASGKGHAEPDTGGDVGAPKESKAYKESLQKLNGCDV